MPKMCSNGNNAYISRTDSFYNEKFVSFDQYLPIFPIPSLWQPPFYSVSMSLAFQKIAHKSEIISYLPFSIYFA